MNKTNDNIPEVENSDEKTDESAPVSSNQQKFLTKKKIVWVTIIFVGCFGVWFFFYPGSVTLYSIDGRVRPAATSSTANTFHGYPVLGKVRIINVFSQNEIMAALKKGIAESDGTMMKCFWPRHGIKISRFGFTTEYVVCFECLQLEIHTNGSKETVATTRSSQSVLNKYLTDAKVPLAPGMVEDH